MRPQLAVIPVLLLTGCGPSFPTIDGSALQAAVAQVRGYTIQICSYIPTNDTVVEIITAGGGIAEGAYKIATAICAAVSEPAPPPFSPAQMGSERMGDAEQCPMLNGVCIRGRFVPKERRQTSMSAELDRRIDASRKKLIDTANVTVGMGNYRQIKRSFEEILLDVHDIMDALNEAISQEASTEGET